MQQASKFITLSVAALLAGGAGASQAAAASAYNESGMHHQQSRIHSERGHSERGAFGRGEFNETERTGTLSGQERMRLREIVHEIPRLSYIGSSDLRIDGFVPRSVRQAAAPLPAEVVAMHPRFRKNLAFRYHDQVVILNRWTGRIVALVKTPAPA